MSEDVSLPLSDRLFKAVDLLHEFARLLEEVTEEVALLEEGDLDPEPAPEAPQKELF